MSLFILAMLGPWQIILILVAFIIPLIAIIDILIHKFPENEKIIWLLVVLFMSLLGTVLYLAIGRKKRLKK